MSDPTPVVYVRFSGPRRGEAGVRLVGEIGDLVRIAAADKADEAPRPRSQAPGRTMSATFTWRDVSRLFEISEGRLRYWDRSGFLSPSGHDGRSRCFTFQDLVCLRSARALLEGGVSVQRARKILNTLKEKLPLGPHPLGRLRIRGDARNVVVVEDEREMEAASGQLLIDFSVKSLEESVVAELPAHRGSRESRTAYEWYLEGCRLDEDPATLAKAEEAYHRAIYLDPKLANAYTNLGNLRYRAGASEDAKILYAKAVEVDAGQPEAHYNLGFLEFEDGNLGFARGCFERAVALDPTFADAHFNLAMTLYRLDIEQDAREHWRRYLALDPEGPWAEIARKRLQEAT
ncbi:MAG: tetratricopeptide repeat protein [Proteobacteria bacterium]|nr:tetratricopeptide repeat protein [Pseudomonadota bacterium]